MQVLSWSHRAVSVLMETLRVLITTKLSALLTICLIAALSTSVKWNQAGANRKYHTHWCIHRANACIKLKPLTFLPSNLQNSQFKCFKADTDKSDLNWIILGSFCTLFNLVHSKLTTVMPLSGEYFYYWRQLKDSETAVIPKSYSELIKVRFRGSLQQKVPLHLQRQNQPCPLFLKIKVLC